MDSNPEFIFFSDFASKKILAHSGRAVGRVCDVALDVSQDYPKASHLIVRRGWLRRRYAAVPWNGIAGIDSAIRLDPAAQPPAFEGSFPYFEFTLVRDILDQQVVDTNGQKVIRVNDIQLLKLGPEVRISRVDVGIRGIVRRLGWQRWVDLFVKMFLSRTDYMKEYLIDWHFVQPLAINPQKGTLKLTVDHKQLSMIPADFNDMMQRMDIHQRLALFMSMPPDVRPKVFSDFRMPLQTELLENMDINEAAALLSKIPADQATDILEEVPHNIAESLLAVMETTQARRLSTLLGYTGDSAGGLMTTEMITAPHTALVSGVLDLLRRTADNDALEAVHHVYLVDDDNRFMGQVLFKRLLLASPSDPVARYAYPKPIYARAKDSLREVAYLMEKYKLPAIPVVNNGKERILQGVIIIDDILAKVIPLAWRRRAKGLGRRAPEIAP